MSSTKKSAGGRTATDSALQSGPEDRATTTVARGPAESASVEGSAGKILPLRAAGTLFGEAAELMHAATEVLTEAIHTEQPAALLFAARALLEKAGAICDRAAHACGAPGLQEPDDWLMSPRGAADMAILEIQRMQKLAANGLQQ